MAVAKVEIFVLTTRDKRCPRGHRTNRFYSFETKQGRISRLVNIRMMIHENIGHWFMDGIKTAPFAMTRGGDTRLFS